MKNYRVSVLGPFAAMGVAAGAVVGAVSGLIGMWILVGGLAGIGLGLLADASARRGNDQAEE